MKAVLHGGRRCNLYGNEFHKAEYLTTQKFAVMIFLTVSVATTSLVFRRA